jgi:glycosyltransferase involved in cell wall biosynthesis
VATEIDGGGYDVVYVHHCQFLLAPTLLRLLETPAVYYAQDTLRDACEWSLTELPGYDSWRDTRYFRQRLGRTQTLPQATLTDRKVQEAARNTRAASLVLCNSWYSREALVRSTGLNPRVCYLGVDAHFFRPDPTIPREPVVLSVGTIFPHKGHRTVLEALATIEPSRRPRMRIIGYELKPGDKTLGPMARELLAAAERYGVELTIDKEVSDEALRDAYRRAAVVAFAPHLEPFGLVTLEAMACGAPVVGIAEGGLRETIQDETTGLLAGRDPEALGAAIERLLADPACAARLSAKGRAAVEQIWSWERSVDELEEWFQRVVGRDPGRTDLAQKERLPAGRPAGPRPPSPETTASRPGGGRRAADA